MSEEKVNRAIEDKLNSMKKLLLDTGKRNRMIHYRETKRTTLRIVNPGCGELFNRLVFGEEELSFQRPIDQSTDLRAWLFLRLMKTLGREIPARIGDLETGAPSQGEQRLTLRNLRSKARLAQEEQGTNILYLSFGFLRWRARNLPSSPILVSPLIMVPAALTERNLNNPVLLSRCDDEIVVNPTLKYRLAHDFDLKLPEFEVENEESLERFFGEMEKIAGERGWELVRDVSLGLVSFLKIGMYYDLENRHDLLVSNPVVRALCGDPKALTLPEAARGPFEPDSVSPAGQHQVIDADSSQMRAIELSRTGASFVMQGPPGTGKSQTIANIIAEALFAGKKVLFVSEKAAALEVVLRRLREAGISDFCLSLHNYRANKRDVLRQIGGNLNLPKTPVQRTAVRDLTLLARTRDELNAYARELHEVIQPLNVTLYEAFGELARCAETAEFTCDIPSPEKVTETEFQDMTLKAERFARTLEALGGMPEGNPWRGTSLRTSNMLYLSDLRRRTEGLREHAAGLLSLMAQPGGPKGAAEMNLREIGEWIGRVSALAGLPPHSGNLYRLNLLKRWKMLQAARKLVRLRQEYERILRENRELTQAFGVPEDWSEAAEVLEYINAAAENKELTAGIPESLSRTFRAGGKGGEKARAWLGRIREQYAAAESSILAFAEVFPGEDPREAPLTVIAERYERCMARMDQLDPWLNYRNAREECLSAGLGDFVRNLEERKGQVRDAAECFRYSFFRAWCEAVIASKPAVAGFKEIEEEEKAEQFRALDTEQFRIARQRIRAKIIGAYPDPEDMTAAGDEMAVLRREMNKRSRIMPLRKLFRTIPNLLLQLKPCLMMSPLSVSCFLEADAYHFDMVIFDEASQIFPQDALGSIMRADQVIIAGDTRQLPPTNFFTSAVDAEEEEPETEDEEKTEKAEIADSILEEADRCMRSSTLLWHYRSRNEQLIAFSNQEIYGNRLITFPGCRDRMKDSGVEFVYVEDGLYEGKPENCNPREAERCVELLQEHIRNYPERSLGIIAFSEKQQQAILDRIQTFREENPGYENFFSENRADPIFVKNLENVQGDERDTILFSVGYGYTKEQRENGKPMSLRFGPLGAAGGERRLNVAITRAKQNIKLVASILPEDIDLRRTQSLGVRMLRDYIRFARMGTEALGGNGQETERDPMREAVREFLEKNGYQVREKLGCSGYRIDLAVEDPKNPNCYLANIECDGPGWAGARTVRERERLRKDVLKNMGWKSCRLWSSEWIRNPEAEGRKLLAFLKNAEEEKNA